MGIKLFVAAMKKADLNTIVSGLTVIAVIYVLLSIFRTSTPNPEKTVGHEQQPASKSAESESIVAKVLSSDDASDQVVPDTIVGGKKIPYSIVKRTSVRGLGYKQLISIQPEHANDADLTALGRMIRNEVLNDYFAFVQVFTSPSAAEMSERLESLSEEEATTCYKSYVACYRKNAAAGVELMELHPEGMNGPMKTIKP